MSLSTEWIEWHNTSASDSECPGFSSWSRLHLVWVTWFFSAPEGNCSNTHYFNFGYDCCIAHHFQFIVHYSSKHSKRFIVSVESVLNHIQTIMEIRTPIFWVITQSSSTSRRKPEISQILTSLEYSIFILISSREINMGKTNWNGKLSKRSNEDSNSKDNIF